MRNFGLVLLIAGVVGFFYASSRLRGLERPPAEASVSETARTEAGRWELARYGAAAAGAIGLILAMFPKGR